VQRFLQDMGSVLVASMRSPPRRKQHTKLSHDRRFAETGKECTMHMPAVDQIKKCFSHDPNPFVGVKSAVVVFTAPVVVVSLELASDGLDQVVEFRVDGDAAFGVLLQNHLS